MQTPGRSHPLTLNSSRRSCVTRGVDDEFEVKLGGIDNRKARKATGYFVARIGRRKRWRQVITRRAFQATGSVTDKRNVRRLPGGESQGTAPARDQGPYCTFASASLLHAEVVDAESSFRRRQLRLLPALSTALWRISATSGGMPQHLFSNTCQSRPVRQALLRQQRGNSRWCCSGDTDL